MVDSPGRGTGRSWSRRDLVAALVVVVLLAAGVVAFVVTRQPGAVDVVRDFLAAVQRRDVTEALRIAGAERPDGERGRFIDAAALDGDWQVVDVTEVDQPRPLTTRTVVAVTLPAAREADKDGERAGKPVQTAEFVLERDGDGEPWRIDEPFAEVRFPYSPLWYLDANGKKVPYDKYDEREPIPTYLFLPGVYRFYAATSDLVEITPQAVTVLGSVAVDPPKVAPTAKANADAQRVANAYIDECARQAEPVRSNCPFGLGLYQQQQLSGPDLKDIQDVRWKVLRYPTVAVAPAVPRPHFSLQSTSVRGLVQLTATGETFAANPKRIPFTVNCSFGVPNMVVGLTAVNTLSVLPAQARYGNEGYADCTVVP